MRSIRGFLRSWPGSELSLRCASNEGNPIAADIVSDRFVISTILVHAAALHDDIHGSNVVRVTGNQHALDTQASSQRIGRLKKGRAAPLPSFRSLNAVPDMAAKTLRIVGQSVAKIEEAENAAIAETRRALRYNPAGDTTCVLQLRQK